MGTSHVSRSNVLHGHRRRRKKRRHHQCSSSDANHEMMSQNSQSHNFTAGNDTEGSTDTSVSKAVNIELSKRHSSALISQPIVTIDITTPEKEIVNDTTVELDLEAQATQVKNVSTEHSIIDGTLPIAPQTQDDLLKRNACSVECSLPNSLVMGIDSSSLENNVEENDKFLTQITSNKEVENNDEELLSQSNLEKKIENNEVHSMQTTSENEINDQEENVGHLAVDNSLRCFENKSQVDVAYNSTGVLSEVASSNKEEAEISSSIQHIVSEDNDRTNIVDTCETLCTSSTPINEDFTTVKPIDDQTY